MQDYCDRVFIEVDGYISSSGTIPSGIGMMLGGLGSLFSSNSSESYVPCKRWVRVSRVDDISFEQHDIELKRAPAQPRLRRADDQGEEPPLEPEEPAPMAPAGWWITLGTMRFHVFDSEAAEALTKSRDQSEIAKAVLRLADEIALKPSNQDGRMVSEAKSDFGSRLFSVLHEDK
jgi:hypothetical protein